MGKALQDGYRDKVFLMTKIDGRIEEGRRPAARRVAPAPRRPTSSTWCSTTRSSAFEDPDRIFAEDGANEALVEAQKAGKIRYIGFTGHKDPHIHLRHAEVADAARLHASTPCRCRSTSWTPTSAASSSWCCRCWWSGRSACWA